MFPNMLVTRQEEMSELHGRVCTTWKDYLLGQELFFTSDPENIKTILATKFENFGLGERRPNMLPTLGDGIVGNLF